jgi:hypothetical protein
VPAARRSGSVSWSFDSRGNHLNSSGGGADFVAAWRKVVTVFRDQGVTNADCLWIMTAYSFKPRDRRRAIDRYPGETYLDHIGADAYNWHNFRPGTSTPWNSLEQLLNPMRQFAQGRAIKGLMVPEWASTEDPAQPKPQGAVAHRRPRPVQEARPGGVQGRPGQQDLQVPERNPPGSARGPQPGG